MPRCLVLSLVLLWPSVAAAGTIVASGVQHAGDRYTLFVTAHIEAPPRTVWRTITDYPRLAAINPAFETSEVLRQDAKSARVRTRIRVCILVFCKSVVQVQDLHYPQPLDIEATMVPGAGDFRAGMATWALSPAGSGTRLQFREWFVPDFWVPPLIGPWLIRRKLVQEVEVTMAHIEGTGHE